MLVELVVQPHCLYFLCTEAIQYVYTILITDLERSVASKLPGGLKDPPLHENTNDKLVFSFAETFTDYFKTVPTF